MFRKVTPETFVDLSSTFSKKTGEIVDGGLISPTQGWVELPNAQLTLEYNKVKELLKITVFPKSNFPGDQLSAAELEAYAARQIDMILAESTTAPVPEVGKLNQPLAADATQDIVALENKSTTAMVGSTVKIGSEVMTVVDATDLNNLKVTRGVPLEAHDVGATVTITLPVSVTSTGTSPKPTPPKPAPKPVPVPVTK
jgi:hypothetical protein